MFASCLGPTEIVVDVTTNACPSLSSTDVYIDGQQVTSAKTPACDPNDPLATIDVGTITVLPTHGIDSHVDIAIVGNVGGTCASPDTTDVQCIVARRSLSFTPHQRLDLPIFLDSACAGLKCLPDQTCVVDETGAHCSDSTCGGGSNKSPSCGDAGEPDVGIPDVNTIDVGPPPTLCPSSLPPLGSPTFSWSFLKPSTDGNVHEDFDAVLPAPPATGSSLASAPPTICSDYLTSKGTQALVTSSSNAITKFSATSFSLGFAFKTTLMLTQLVTLTTASQSGGFTINVSSGTINMAFNGPISQEFYVGNTPVSNGLWHRFGVVVTTTGAGSTVKLYVDGTLDKTVNTGAYTAGGVASFALGTADFDDVVYYAQ
jgi:hypothetical protein